MTYAAPRVVGAPYASRVVAPRVVGARVIVGAPIRSFAVPYYTFRPRVSIGFGVTVGFPIAYPSYLYTYPYPYGYAYPYPSPYGYPSGSPYGYAAPAVPPAAYPYPSTVTPVPAQPSASVDLQTFGGISFDITPPDAEVLIDGQAAGVVGAFTATSQPLTLAPGRHHLEIRASGYRSVSDDVDVRAGEVIPYHGQLER